MRNNGHPERTVSTNGILVVYCLSSPAGKVCADLRNVFSKKKSLAVAVSTSHTCQYLKILETMIAITLYQLSAYNINLHLLQVTLVKQKTRWLLTFFPSQVSRGRVRMNLLQRHWPLWFSFGIAQGIKGAPIGGVLEDPSELDRVIQRFLWTHHPRCLESTRVDDGIFHWSGAPTCM